MAHAPSVRAAVRRAYIHDRAPLSEAARRAGVAPATARTWKRAAAAAGDDWGRAREAARMAAGGLGGVTERVLEGFSLHFVSTMEALRTSPAEPVDVARAMATLADAYAKIMAAAGRADPKLARLSVALETLERIGAYIRESCPHLLPEILAAIEKVGGDLAVEWG